MGRQLPRLHRADRAGDLLQDPRDTVRGGAGIVEYRDESGLAELEVKGLGLGEREKVEVGLAGIDREDEHRSHRLGPHLGADMESASYRMQMVHVFPDVVR